MYKYLWLLLFIPSVAVSDLTATLSWDAPTTNVDGSTLTDLAGFRVYRSQTAGEYTGSPIHEITDTQQTSYTISNHPDGIYYYTLTAFDQAGNESEKSNEVSFNVEPGKPINLIITITVQVQ